MSPQKDPKPSGTPCFESLFSFWAVMIFVPSCSYSVLLKFNFTFILFLEGPSAWPGLLWAKHARAPPLNDGTSELQRWVRPENEPTAAPCSIAVNNTMKICITVRRVMELFPCTLLFDCSHTSAQNPPSRYQGPQRSPIGAKALSDSAVCRPAVSTPPVALLSKA